MYTDSISLILAFLILFVIQILINYHDISLSYFFVKWIRFGNIIVALFLFAAWTISLKTFGLYRAHSILQKNKECFDALRLTIIATFVLLLFSNLFSIESVTKFFIVNFWFLSFLLVYLSRKIIFLIFKITRIKGVNTIQVLIIGTSKRALGFADKIYSTPDIGYSVLGFLDDSWEGTENLDKKRYPLLGSLDDLKNILENNIIDEVIIGLPIKSFYEKISQIINLCEEQGVIVRMTANFFDLRIARSSIDLLDNIPLLTLHSAPINLFSLLIKRIIDIIVSLIIILVLLPFLPLIAIIIKLDDNGPVFFAQERVGLNKRTFKLLKFRTMVVNAEKLRKQLEKQNEATGPVFKIKDDPRLTRLGKWLRKTSIDELPQFYNVLKGDMSLVGPRPPIMSEVVQYKWEQRRRLSMKPGITCIWQVSGRSDIPFEKWMELDMEYIDNWNLLLDFKILFKTIPAVLRGSGAS